MITLLVEQVVSACCPSARHHNGTAWVLLWKTEFLISCIFKGLKVVDRKALASRNQKIVFFWYLHELYGAVETFYKDWNWGSRGGPRARWGARVWVVSTLKHTDSLRQPLSMFMLQVSKCPQELESQVSFQKIKMEIELPILLLYPRCFLLL